MANTSPATCQCLATFTPLKIENVDIFRDAISLLARVVISFYLLFIQPPITGEIHKIHRITKTL